MEVNKIYLSWEQVEGLIKDLILDIKLKNLKFNKIHGLSRGGLIPAVLLSHQLSIPYTDSIDDDTLVVDDICDSGETLKNLTSKFKVKTAVLHYKPITSSFTPTIYADTIYSKNDWIIYPWERKDSKTIQDYKLN